MRQFGEVGQGTLLCWDQSSQWHPAYVFHEKVPSLVNDVCQVGLLGAIVKLP